MTKPQISADKSQSDDPDVSDEAEDESDPDEEPSQATQPPSKSKPINNTPRKVKPLLRPPRSLETTLFDRLEKMYGNGIKRMLTVQYRSVSIVFQEPMMTERIEQNARSDCFVSIENYVSFKADFP